MSTSVPPNFLHLLYFRRWSSLQKKNPLPQPFNFSPVPLSPFSIPFHLPVNLLLIPSYSLPSIFFISFFFHSVLPWSSTKTSVSPSQLSALSFLLPHLPSSSLPFILLPSLTLYLLCLSLLRTLLLVPCTSCFPLPLVLLPFPWFFLYRTKGLFFLQQVISNPKNVQLCLYVLAKGSRCTLDLCSAQPCV